MLGQVTAMKTSPLLCAAALLATPTWAAARPSWSSSWSSSSPAALLPESSLLGPRQTPEQQQQQLQDVVTWDEKSLFVRGERVFLFSGEVHPFRLPVPSLWLDVFQKIRALGLNGVSFYVDWALLEGKPGDFTAEGVFALEPFFEAAQQAGIYLIARPGPYINAEVSGGGFPGWLQRVKAVMRAATPEFLQTTDHYMDKVGRIIADAQITNGGPVILFQPENEYTVADDFMQFPDGAYMQYVEDQIRAAGITVPLISNDAKAAGHNAPGTGPGEVDIYGHDGYPLGFDCANPTQWPEGNLPTDWRATHLAQSPSTPYALLEFQGGSFDPWGGWGFDRCAALVNHEQVRVFYKNNIASGVSIFNIYMIFGGTNWGNLGHPGGYTSYDYGAVIAEDRTVAREKYSELKLIAQFVQSSPGLLLAEAGNPTTGVYSDNDDVTITALLGSDGSGDNDTATTGSFFVVRHTDYTSQDAADYTVNLPTSRGNLSIPSSSSSNSSASSLTLLGRDSKIMVADYDVHGTNLLYSTADVFSSVRLEGNKSAIFLYASSGEYNEFAIEGTAEDVEAFEDGAQHQVISPSGGALDGYVAIGWQASTTRSRLRIRGTDVYLLDRNAAHTYWVTPLANTNYSIVVDGPYLVRNASLSSDGTLELRADFNATTTPVGIIGAPGDSDGAVKINGKPFDFSSAEDDGGILRLNVSVSTPDLDIPSIADLDWRYIDSLPELSSEYSDAEWTRADKTTSNNSQQLLINTESLYGSDYGFHAGMLVYRGHFNATGDETGFALWAQGGSGFAAQAWLDSTLLGSNSSNGSAAFSKDTYNFTETLEPGTHHVLTVLVDNMGLDEQYTPGENTMQEPRGIVGWRLSTSKASTTPVEWKIAGNLGGEDYADRVRGPLNEGGLYVERMGYHLPQPPSDDWKSRSPLLSEDEDEENSDDSPGGVAFYSAPLDLDLPADEWDVPLSFVFKNDTADASSYRAQLYVNGWQFGKLGSVIGPQTAFPVPEGILDYGGRNWVGLVVWALEKGAAAKVPGLELVAGTPVWTGRQAVQVVDSPKWEEREGAF